MEEHYTQRLGVSVDLSTYDRLKRLVPYGIQEKLLRKLVEDFTTELNLIGTRLCYDYLADRLNMGRYAHDYYEREVLGHVE